ncbi:hypothetical protein PUNSTDRAFT_62720, partial [Punctularia strigosozonata HHB-11173 SS5]|uniref:uncharacterized protein n=1 Tax=Punctularia strigosozonata (strain HHB-11173) TaxID=741275 RepID=UPI00044175FA
IGNVTVFDSDDQIDDVEALQACYLRRHPDARGWLPDSPRAPHLSYWARFDPQAIYYVGGFGSEHYIGYIPLNLYQEALASTMGPVGVAGRFLVQTGQMS